MPKRKHQPLIGISIFVILIVFDSLINIGHLINVSKFRENLVSFSNFEIFMRYLWAWMIRLGWIVGGIGILSHKEIFRKTLVIVSVLSIVSVYWKFSYVLIEPIAQPFYTNLAAAQSTLSARLSLEQFTWIVIFILYFIDTVFAGGVLIYFSRDKVKNQFK
ncbi:MAG: hypothetical protein H6755_06150 [Candidatus Omnitrophica bacterium]|nr:hypothetical protein [Candidatus Omnitrophota bacterium]